jgi:NAD(P)-dependent dehydrogenase (short-subunit alcohol dehydrogenase family)
MRVLAVGRTADRLAQVAESARVSSGGTVETVVADVTQEKEVLGVFERVRGDNIALVVFNAGNNARIALSDLTAAEIEDFWRVGCFAGFLVGKAAADVMTRQGSGTIIFTGASASLRGRPGFAHFAAAKAGLRMLSQSMAREFGPAGIHVAHVAIDGGINGERLRSRYPDRSAQSGDDGLLNIDALAEAYWQLHRQHRSAWTQELDLRPFKEVF